MALHCRLRNCGVCGDHIRGESLFAQQTRSPSPITTAQSPTAPPVSQSPQATPGQTPSSELANLEAKVRPSVVWVSTFDSKGNLLRTESGFFISADGRLLPGAHAVEGGVNAVAKTADRGIYNVERSSHRFEVGGFGGAQGRREAPKAFEVS